MRVSSAAIFTLVSLAASNIHQQATANDSTAIPDNQQGENLVIPVVEDTAAPTEVISQPETLITQQFSQKSVNSEQLSVNSKQLSVQNQQKQTQIVIKNGSNPPISQSPPLPPSQIPVKTGNDFVVRATEVRIVGVTSELQSVIQGVIKTQPGGETSQTQLEQDVTAILDTGLFAGATVNSRSNEQGLSVVFQVKPLIVNSLQLTGAKALSYEVAQTIFQSQIGKPISPSEMKTAVENINKWYTENSYSLARVIAIKPNRQGVLDVNVAEGTIQNIQFRFINDDNQTVDKKVNQYRDVLKGNF